MSKSEEDEDGEANKTIDSSSSPEESVDASETEVAPPSGRKRRSTARSHNHPNKRQQQEEEVESDETKLPSSDEATGKLLFAAFDFCGFDSRSTIASTDTTFALLHTHC